MLKILAAIVLSSIILNAKDIPISKIQTIKYSGLLFLSLLRAVVTFAQIISPFFLIYRFSNWALVIFLFINDWIISELFWISSGCVISCHFLFLNSLIEYPNISEKALFISKLPLIPVIDFPRGDNSKTLLYFSSFLFKSSLNGSN